MRWPRCEDGGTARSRAGQRPFYTLVKLRFAVGYASAGEIVGGDFDADGVAGDDADVVAAHFTGEVSEDDVALFDFDAEHGVGKGFFYYTA